MKSRKNAVKTDERTIKNTGTAAVITLAVIWVALIIIGVVKTVKYGAESITEEMIIFLGSVLLFLIMKHRGDDVDLPESFLGKPLPDSLSGEDKAARLKAYAIDSLINGAFLASLNIILNRINRNFSYTFIPFSGGILSIVLNFVIDTLVMFAVFMLVNYLWGEHNVKKYNKMMEENEEDCP